MARMILKAGIASACLFMFTILVPRANAGSIQFACGAPASNLCSGTVSSTGGLGFTTSGIGMESSFDGTEEFTTKFMTNSTGMGSISVSAADGDSLSGNIVGTSAAKFGGEETLTFNVDWTSLSAGVQSALGASSGVGQSVVEFKTNTTDVASAYLHISSGTSPVPEPSTLFLLGIGILGVGLAFRRHVLATS
jgi:hypothetical protein